VTVPRESSTSKGGRAHSPGMATLPEPFDHPAWLTGAGTVAGYGVILLVLFVALFVVPYLLFTLL